MKPERTKKPQEKPASNHTQRPGKHPVRPPVKQQTYPGIAWAMTRERGEESQR